MTQDNATERRSDSICFFLQHFENYINEIIKSSHDAKPDEIILTVKNKFERSMLANAEHLEYMAELNRKANDHVNSNYRKLQADIYKAIIAK